MVSFQGIHLLQVDLPPLLSPNPGTMIWTIVTFVLLLVVLGKFAWKPLLAALEAREKGIQDSLETAERLKKESEALLEQHEEKLRAAADEVKSILEEGRRDADVLRAGILEKAQSDAKDTLGRATREIGLAKDKALDEIRQEAVDLSVALASKVIEKSLRPEDHEELIRGSMKELKL